MLLSPGTQKRETEHLVVFSMKFKATVTEGLHGHLLFNKNNLTVSLCAYHLTKIFIQNSQTMSELNGS